MNAGLNLIKDLTPLLSGNPAMLASQMTGVIGKSNLFSSLLDGFGGSMSNQNIQNSFNADQNQQRQADLTSSQNQETRPVDQSPSPKSNNQSVDQQRSNQEVKQQANAQKQNSKDASDAKASADAANKDANNQATDTKNAGDANAAKASTDAKNKTQDAATSNNAADSAQTMAQQAVSMAEVLKGLNLNADQINKMAAALNTTPEQLGKMQVTFGGASTGATGTIDAGKLMAKVADVLNLNKAQTETMFASLNVNSVDIKNLAAPAAISAPVASTTQLTPANPALVAQVTTADVKQTAQMDFSGSNLDFGAQSGTGTGVTQQVSANVASNQNEFSAALGAVSGANGAPGAVNSAAGLSPSAAQDHANGAIMGQIVEKASILNLPNATETRINLSPEKLGSVDIKLTMTDSSVTASIVVGSDAVKHIVEKNLDQLKSALQGQGIMVEQMNVSVGQQGNQSFGNGSMFAQNAETGRGSGAEAKAAPASISAINNTAGRRSGKVLVDLTA